MKSSSRVACQRVRQAKETQFNPIAGLEPSKLASWLNAFRTGDLRSAALVWDVMMERDLTLKGVAEKRFKDVSRRPWEVMAINDSERAQQHAAALRHFYNQVRTSDALDAGDRGGFQKLVRQMMRAVANKYAVHEMMLKPRRNDGVELELSDSEAKFKPGTLLTAEFKLCPLWWFENRYGRLAFLPNDFAYTGEPIKDGEWLVTVGDGLMVSTSVGYMYKHMGLKSWLNHQDKFGLPIIDAVTDAAPDSPEWNALAEAVDAFSEDFALIRSRSSEINIVEVGKNADAPFKPMVDYMDRAMITLWRGGDLSTLSSEKGMGTGASLQEGEGNILVEDDCALITEALNDYVDRFVLGYLFNEEPLAYITILPPRLDNTDADIKIAEFFLKHQAPVGVNQMRERLGLPEPEEDDEMLVLEETKPKPGQFNNARPEIVEDLRAAVKADSSFALQRLARILEINDEALQMEKLRAWLADYPKLIADATADPKMARVLQSHLLTEFIKGLEGNPTLANGDLPGHPFRGNQYTSGVAQIELVIAGKTPETVYADVSAEMAGRIKASTGEDVAGFRHLVDHDALVHINKQHGVGREDQEGHEPVTREDILKIPEIVDTPDTIEPGQTGRGFKAIKYGKRYSGTTYFVEEVWSREKVLAAKTMYKTKAPGESATPKGGVSHTSETSGAKRRLP